jgi:minor extracellular serine protease Vpr
MRLPIFFLLVAAAFAQPPGRPVEYALLLEDPPVAHQTRSRAELHGAAAEAHLGRIRTAQSHVLAELAARKVPVAATSQLLVNAIFVRVTPDRLPTLQGIPGVKRVVFQPSARPMLTSALNLVDVPAAWTAIGGSANAGAGIKIGVIDTGIDQNHPGFKDTGFTMPSGFPLGDSSYTNNKVIVARSYVSYLQTPDNHYSTPGDYNSTPDPAYTTPDDLTPRDRQGHGTAIAMIAAGVANTSPLGTITGVAPKAYLGNYKVFGSPGVNEYTYRAAWVRALTDAVTDGMDIVTLSLGEGDTAYYGPQDTDADCSDSLCDVGAMAVENASKNGVLVVAAAGNGGNSGYRGVNLTSIASPGTAPSALTVGAFENSHVLYNTMNVVGSGLLGLRARLGDGPKITSSLIAPIKDVATLGNDGQACSTLPAGSLTGAFALIQRGTCFVSDKVNFAQAAGAIGALIYEADGVEDPGSRMYVGNTGIPSLLIGNSDGKAIKAEISVIPRNILINPATQSADNGLVNRMASFSGRGPAIGNFATTRDYSVKPEIVAPGTQIYSATQKFDPNADTYDVTGYATFAGTSFAVPFAAGVAAMAKAANPALNTPSKLKSAVVNTATADLVGTARILDAGAGRLNAAGAVAVTATLEPAAISLGSVTKVPVSQNLTITNLTNSRMSFTFTVRQTTPDANASIQLSQPSISLGAGTNQTVQVTLAGTRPFSGAYEGFIDVTPGTGPTLHLPYYYASAFNTPYDIYPLQNSAFIAPPNDYPYLLAFRCVDSAGVPVTNAAVNFRIVSGSGKWDPWGGDAKTSALGNAGIWVDLGGAGTQLFTGTVGNFTQNFEGRLRNLPSIQSGGVVNAAPPYQLGQGLAPGSYISLFGNNLADATLVEGTTSLPLSLSQIAVSFSSGGRNLPGHLHFVSPGQINVQIPWELQGQSSAQVKVSVYGYLLGALTTFPLAQYSPGIFAVTDGATGSVISASNPARRGGSIVIYANGLGPVDTPQVSGEPASLVTLARTIETPAVTLGGRPTTFYFSGLTPGSVGLYQVNAGIPSDAPTGGQVLKLSIGGQDTTLTLPVQ